MTTSAALAAAQAQFAGAATGDAPPSALWGSAEAVLQAAFGAPALHGQALVGEGRRLQAITLADAHALVALLGWVDRLSNANASDDLPAQWRVSRASVAESAWTALEHAAAWQPNSGAQAASIPVPRAPLAPAPIAPVAHAEIRAETAERRSPRRARWVLLAAALLVIGGLGSQFYLDRARHSGYDGAVSAYERGDRSAARAQFIAFADAHPNDARPLIFLGRIAREDGDLPTARRYLQSAATKAPGNALAHRELASALLADNDLELARNFYVRAIQLDPADRVAQGYLACTLHKMGRDDTARPFATRAGEGAWTACLNAPVSRSSTPTSAPAR